MKAIYIAVLTAYANGQIKAHSMGNVARATYTGDKDLKSKSAGNRLTRGPIQAIEYGLQTENLKFTFDNGDTVTYDTKQDAAVGIATNLETYYPDIV